MTGFRESRWATLQRTEPGDYFLCYLTGVSRFVGLLEVAGPPFRDDTGSIWADDDFPCRLPVRTVAILSMETGVPIQHLADSLSMFANLTRPTAWTGAVQVKASNDGTNFHNYGDSQDTAGYYIIDPLPEWIQIEGTVTASGSILEVEVRPVIIK